MENRTFYAQKVETWIAEDSTPTYMVRVEKALEDERQRVTAFMNIESEAKLLQVIFITVPNIRNKCLFLFSRILCT